MFRVWRQDDNGNVFTAGTFVSRREAEERLAELTRVLHKQTYWIEECEGEPDRQRPAGDMRWR